MLKLNLGDNYVISEKPENIQLALPNKSGALAFSTTVVGNQVNLLFNLNFNEAIYPPEYYPYLKEFMSKVVDTQTNSLIVLKKK